MLEVRVGVKSASPYSKLGLIWDNGTTSPDRIVGACSLSCSVFDFFVAFLLLAVVLSCCSFRRHRARPRDLISNTFERARAKRDQANSLRLVVEMQFLMTKKIERAVNTNAFCCSRLQKCTTTTLFA